MPRNWKDLSNQILSALGVLSLLQGTLSIGEGLTELVRYYEHLRDFLFWPSQKIGIHFSDRFENFLFIATFFFGSYIRTKFDAGKFGTISYLGTLLLLYPILYSLNTYAALTELCTTLIQVNFTESELHWSILLVLVIIICWIMFLIAFVGIGLILLAASIPLWFVALFFPPIVSIYFATSWLFNLIGKKLNERHLGKLSFMLVAPGYFLYFLISYLFKGKILSAERFLRLQRIYMYRFALRPDKLITYYKWIGVQFGYLFFTILLFKVAFDTW